jgi:hypothetical protein
MPRRRVADVDAELSECTTSIEIARAQLFDVDVDRKKRIDDAIDYFGGGTSTSPGRVSANTSRSAGTPPYGYHARL